MGVALWRRGGSLRSAAGLSGPRGRARRCLYDTARITLKLENCLNALVAAAAARSNFRQRAMVAAAAFKRSRQRVSGHPRSIEGYRRSEQGQSCFNGTGSRIFLSPEVCDGPHGRCAGTCRTLLLPTTPLDVFWALGGRLRA